MIKSQAMSWYSVCILHHSLLKDRSLRWFNSICCPASCDLPFSFQCRIIAARIRIKQRSILYCLSIHDAFKRFFRELSHLRMRSFSRFIFNRLCSKCGLIAARIGREKNKKSYETRGKHKKRSSGFFLKFSFFSFFFG